MKAETAESYDLRVPRYTSYPTAPHFSPAVDGDVYARWLGAFDPGQTLSLYFHIPFCAEMCWFCGCYTKIVRRYAPVAEYLETLLAEVDLVAGLLPGRFRVRHLHWGGGSPTMLRPEDWRRTFERLRARFEVAADAEIAVELDPRTATEDYVAALGEAGVTRASIGVQDFDPEVQRAINRLQPYSTTARVVRWLRGHGIGGLNMDLMYGLPHQTVERVVAMVERAVGLSPDRVALFGYAHVPWMKRHQRLIDEATLPGAAARLAQFEAASERLIAAGYVAVGLDHFALPADALAKALAQGRLRRNFQGYTTDDADALLGFGASAIGALPQGYVQNAAPLGLWAKAVRGGRPATVRGFVLSPEDRLRAALIERLMCDMRVDVAALLRRFGVAEDHFDRELAGMGRLVEDGIVAISGRTLAVTPAGRPLVRVVASAFDGYLSPGERRHARAV